jgi:hypothetical protein
MLARGYLVAAALTVAAIHPDPALAQEKGWDITRQEEAVSSLEEGWEQIQALLGTEDAEERQSLLEKYGKLKRETHDIEDWITAAGPRRRLERIREGMKEKWGALHWHLIKNLEGEARRLLPLMEESYEDRRFPDVLLIHEMWLDRLLEIMPGMSPDLKEPADDLRTRAKDLVESAISARQIEADGIEVGGDWWILNHRETPEPVPEGMTYLPTLRRYRHLDCIHGRPDLEVERFVQDRLQVSYTRADGSQRSVLLPYQKPDVRRRIWAVPTQRVILAVWERRWDDWQGEKDPDEDVYQDLREDIRVWGEKITATELRKRLDVLEQAMRVKCTLRPRIVDEGEDILAGMQHALRERRYHDVSVAYLQRLWPLAKALTKDDPELAQALLERGRALQEEARPFRDAGSWRLELLTTEVAGQTRAATIVNHAPRLDGSEPSGKRYLEGDAVDGIEGLFVLEVHDGRVRCKYRGRYVLDIISP